MIIKLSRLEMDKFKNKLFNLYKYNVSIQSTNSKFRLMVLLRDAKLHYKFTSPLASEIDVLHFEVEL